MSDTIFFDKILAYVDHVLGLSKIPLAIYLMTMALLFLIVTFTLLISAKALRLGRISHGTSRGKLILNIPVILSIVLTLVGFALSINSFHLHILLIVGILSSIASLLYIVVKEGSMGLLLILIVILVFLRGSIHSIVGIEEGETTSDMINIYLNGYFRWSIHGGHYDLAPMDAILKVMFISIAGSDVFDPIAASLIYSFHGLALILMALSLARLLSVNLRGSQVAALTTMSFMVYPYSILIGLSTPPVPLSQSLGVIILTLLIRGMLHEVDTGRYKTLLTVLPLLFYSILIHPTSLGLVLTLFILSIVTLKIHRANRIITIYTTILAFTLYFSKIIYTAFILGYVSFFKILWSYVMNAFTREELSIATITTRNLGYSVLPKVSLTGFAVFPAITAGYAMWIILRHRRRVFSDPLDLFYLGVAAIYYASFITAYLTAIGGVSQSRVIFNGVEPYMEFALLLHMVSRIHELGVSRFKVIALLIALASLFTLITPNAMPLNYTIPMAKPATLNDHVISYMFMGLVDKGVFTSFYASFGETGRLVAIQERGEFSYGMGSTMSVVYYFIAPRVVDAKSYWDPRVMAVFSTPREASGYIVNRVFDAWIYAFYVYTKGS